jgi:imidazolonepropionase-like amidohydrolase
MQETWAIHGVYPAMSWTPDGKSIVFWAGGKIQRVDVASKAVADIPFHVADTRKAREAVRFPVNVAPDSFDVKMIRWAKTSPDGSKVVFEALGKLWIRDLPNGTQRRLTKQTNHFELYPSWSRDGKSIVYTTWNDDELGSIRVISAAGGEGRKVNKTPGRFVEPVFSPDGKTIVYRTSTDGVLLSSLWTRDPGIYRVATAGGDPVLISDKGSAPQFGASNDRVYFTGRQDKLIALKSADLSGHDVRTHLTSEFASEFAVSPDENWVAWNERFNAYVAPFAKSGRAISVAVDGKALPQTKVTRDAGDWVHWSGDSRTLHWALGPELFSRDLKQSFNFVEGAPAELPKPPEAGINLSFKQAAYRPSGRVALTGARLVTMKGDEVIEDGVVVLNGNRIEAIGPRASTAVPADAKVMDMTGKTITPGLIDAHWHGSMGSDEIIPQRSWVNYAALAFGVTTIHDPSNDTSEIFAASELEKAGTIVGPRIFSTGTILYGAATPFTAKIESLDDALGTLRRMKAVGAWSVKSYNQPRRDQRQQIIEAANELGVMVVPEGGSLYEHNMTMVLDGHTTVEHSLPLAHIYADVKQIWPQTKVAYTPTLIVAYGGAFGENYWYQESKVYDDPRLTQYVPRRLLDARARRPVLTPGRRAEPHLDRPRGHHAEPPGRLGADRRPRPARRPGRALGAVGLRPGRHDADGGPARGHHQWRQGAWHGQGPGLAGSGQAGRPDRLRRQPAGEHPQHLDDLVHRGQRPGVRRQDERGRQAGPPAVLVPERGRRGAERGHHRGRYARACGLRARGRRRPFSLCASAGQDYVCVAPDHPSDGQPNLYYRRRIHQALTSNFYFESI